MIKKSELAKRSAKKIEMPIEVANETVDEGDYDQYESSTFFVGQTVTVIKPLDIKEEELISESGEELTIELKNKIRKTQLEINRSIAKRELTGSIFRIEGDYLLIDFNKKYPFTTDAYPMSEVFPDKKTFFSFHKEICGYKKQDNGDVLAFVAQTSTETTQQKCEKLISSKRTIVDFERRIAEYIESINDYKKRLIEQKMILDTKMLEIQEEKTEDFSELEDYVRNIYKNKDVESIKVATIGGRQGLLVTTKELHYTDTVRHDYDRTSFGFAMDGVDIPNIGAYKFILYKDGSLMATNFTKRIGGSEKHPCINGSFNVCVGAHFGSAVKTALQKGDFASAIHMTIDFIKDPNSSAPYRDATEWLLAQPLVLNKPVEKDEDWFNGNTYMDLPFDRDLYRNEIARIGEELKSKEIITPSTPPLEIFDEDDDEDDD